MGACWNFSRVSEGCMIIGLAATEKGSSDMRCNSIVDCGQQFLTIANRQRIAGLNGRARARRLFMFIGQLTVASFLPQGYHS
jgi:hypothetical protein